MTPNSDYVTPAEYAQLHGRHINTVMKWIRLDWLPHETVMRGQRPRYYIHRDTPEPYRHPGPLAWHEQPGQTRMKLLYDLVTAMNIICKAVYRAEQQFQLHTRSSLITPKRDTQ